MNLVSSVGKKTIGNGRGHGEIFVEMFMRGYGIIFLGFFFFGFGAVECHRTKEVRHSKRLEIGTS